MGKTALAFALADRYPVHLIGVDATLVYRGLAVGAAQPTAAELAAYPHDLIDIRDPADPYSVADFLTDARSAMARARAAGRIPLLVGGTMLYFRALQEGLAELPEARPAFRAASRTGSRRRGSRRSSKPCGPRTRMPLGALI